VDKSTAQRNHTAGPPVRVVLYFLVGKADPGFRDAGRVATARLPAALAVASGLLDAAAMTS